MDKDFIIIKFYEQFALKMPGVPDSFTQWAVISARKDRSGNTKLRFKRLEHREAMGIVRENGLVEVLRNKQGVIFDTKKMTFQKRYHGLPLPEIR